MAVTRPTKETLYLRRPFTEEQRLKMGDELAQAHNRVASIKEEEDVVKAQFKERKTAVEQSIGTLSRNIANGFEMANVVCELRYDTPNVGEVTYVSEGERIEKVRPMTMDERQMEFDLEGNGPTEVIPPEKSAENIEEFFEKPAGEVEDGLCENCEKKFPETELRDTDDDVTLCPECWKVCIEDAKEEVHPADEPAADATGIDEGKF
jgi:hypothetical protein